MRENVCTCPMCGKLIRKLNKKYCCESCGKKYREKQKGKAGAKDG